MNIITKLLGGKSEKKKTQKSLKQPLKTDGDIDQDHR